MQKYFIFSIIYCFFGYQAFSISIDNIGDGWKWPNGESDKIVDETLHNMAANAYHNKKYDEAITYIKLNIRNKNYQIFGLVSIMVRDNKISEDVRKELLNLMILNNKALFNMGYTWYKKNFYLDAIRWFELAKMHGCREAENFIQDCKAKLSRIGQNRIIH